MRIALEIAALVATKNEIIGDAGRYWHQDPATLKAIQQIETEIQILEDSDADEGDNAEWCDPNVETRAQLDYEMFCNYVEDCIELQDGIETRGVTYRTPIINDEIPF
jgi:hypothetical protein